VAIINFCGFELGNATSILNEFDLTSGTLSIQSTVKRTGNYALRVNPTGIATAYVQFRQYNSSTGLKEAMSIANLFVVFYWRADTIAASTREDIIKISNGLDVFDLACNSAGKLQLLSGSTQLGSNSNVTINTGQWYRIEINLNDTANTQEVRVDGVTEITASQTSSASWGNIRLGKPGNRGGNSVDYYYDDFAISDSDWIGAGEARLALPIGAGAAAGWTNGTGTTFAEVDEVPPESDGTDATYIQAAATEDNQNHTFDMQTWATIGGVGTIKAVKPMVIAKTGSTTGTSSVGLRRLFNGTGYNLGSGFELTTAYQMLAVIDEDDIPGAGGSAIDSTDFDSIEVGMFAGTIAQTQRFTWAGLGVWSDGISPSGTIVAALQKTTASLTGNQPFTGTLSAAAQKVVAALSGSHIQTGTLDGDLAKVVAALSGSQSDDTSGTIVAVLENILFSGSGAQAQSGAVAAVLQEALMAASGYMLPEGAIVAALQKTTFAGTGSQAASGTLTAALARALFAASGSQTQSGTIGATVQAILLAAAGAQIQSGSIDADLRAVQAALTGAQIYLGVLDADVGKVVFAGIGESPPSGSISAQLSPATFAASGLQEIIGQLAASAAAVVLQAYGESWYLDPAKLVSLAESITAGEAFRKGRMRVSRHVGPTRQKLKQRY
jgi:hypothetical protein